MFLTAGRLPSKIFVCDGSTLCSPNEDFGRMNKRWNADFRSTFQWLIAQIEYSRPWIVLPSKSGFPLLFLLPKSSFGWGTLFKRFVAQIEYSHTWSERRHHNRVGIFVRTSNIFVWGAYMLLQRKRQTVVNASRMFTFGVFCKPIFAMLCSPLTM